MRLALHDLERLAILVRTGIQEQELREALDGGERVVQLVAEAAQERSDRREAIASTARGCLGSVLRRGRPRRLKLTMEPVDLTREHQGKVSHKGALFLIPRSFLP